MGRKPGQILLAGGPDVDEDGLDEIVLWPSEEEAKRSAINEEEDGPAPPF